MDLYTGSEIKYTGSEIKYTGSEIKYTGSEIKGNISNLSQGNRSITSRNWKYSRQALEIVFYALSPGDKIRKLAERCVCQAVAEVIEVFKERKLRLVRIDILRDFRSYNNTHGFLSTPPQKWKEMIPEEFLTW